MAEASSPDSHLDFAAAGRLKVEFCDFERFGRSVGRFEPSLSKNGGFDAHVGGPG
jgi:hypothetical protein